LHTYKTLQAGNISEAKKLSTYNSFNEVVEAKHFILNNFRLNKTQKEIVNFLLSINWKNKTHGVYFISYRTIAEKLNVSERTIERNFPTLKGLGIFEAKRSSKDAGERGADYKILASLEDLKKMSGTLSGTLSGSEDTEKPVTPTAEDPKKETELKSFNKIPTTKNKTKELNKRKMSKNVHSKYKFVNFHVKNILKNFHWDEVTTLQIAKKIEQVLNYKGFDINSEKTQKAVYNGVHYARNEMKKGELTGTDRLLACIWTAVSNQLDWYGENFRQTASASERPEHFSWFSNFLEGEEEFTPSSPEQVEEVASRIHEMNGKKYDFGF
jgi:hypothetical protein